MYETLMRPHETSQISPLKSIREVGDHLKLLAQKREDKRQRQIANSRARNQTAHAKAEASAAALMTKRKRDDGDDDIPADDGLKRVKTDEEDVGEVDDGLFVPDEAPATQGDSFHSLPPQTSSNPGALNVSKVFPDVRGHTSYLTFACLVPQTLYSPAEANQI
jgi:tRNA (adenine57-N1/adenine58-N1)-methyltransferase catalytic subunit